MYTGYYAYEGGACVPPPPYQFNPCLVTEKARVQGVAFLAPGFAFIDPTSRAEWTAGIAAGNIILLPETRGKYDGGSPKKGEGYGKQKERTLFYDYSLDFKDLNMFENQAFYDTIDKVQNWTLAFFTDTLLWLVNAPVNVSTKDPVTENIEDEVVEEVMVTWQYAYKPQKFSVPGLLAAFQVA